MFVITKGNLYTSLLKRRPLLSLMSTRRSLMARPRTSTLILCRAVGVLTSARIHAQDQQSIFKIV
ncbi:hypothetical protein M3Y98_00104400 [Aphelenchoides besseyi]|nr:hypothetical protein M3Y98_00104400 [Aphelenchoides besseyi]